MKYYVVQKYYDSGRSEAELLNETQARERDLDKEIQKENPNYDLYVDTFDNLEQARKRYQETINA